MTESLAAKNVDVLHMPEGLVTVGVWVVEDSRFGTEYDMIKPT